MTQLEGVISVKREKGIEVLLMDDIPLVKLFTSYNGKNLVLTIESKSSACSFQGEAEIFYFEGQQQFHRGIKYVYDFIIDEIDMVEVFEKLQGQKVSITVEVEG